MIDYLVLNLAREMFVLIFELDFRDFAIRKFAKLLF